MYAEDHDGWLSIQPQWEPPIYAYTFQRGGSQPGPDSIPPAGSTYAELESVASGPVVGTAMYQQCPSYQLGEGIWSARPYPDIGDTAFDANTLLIQPLRIPS